MCLCSHRFRSYLPALAKLSQLWKNAPLNFSFSCGINNLTVKIREIKNITTRCKTIETNIENPSDKKRCHTPHFRTQGANWDEWCKSLHNSNSQFISSFPQVSKSIIDDQTNPSVNIITTSQSSFLSITEKYEKN